VNSDRARRRISFFASWLSPQLLRAPGVRCSGTAVGIHLALIRAQHFRPTQGYFGTPSMAGEFSLTVNSAINDGGTCLPPMDYTLVIVDGGSSSSSGSSGG